MMTPQAVFRADASAAVGTGHVVRCRTLADALMARGWTATLASRELPAGLAKSIAATDLQILDLGPDPAPLAEADTIGAATDGRITLLVADHYGIGADWLEAARDRVDVLMAIDDLADRRQPVDLLLNQNLGADAARYAELVPPAARVLTGPRYALIRPEFAQARARGRIRRGHVDRILVFMSGSDPTDVTVRVVAALAGIDVAIDVVTGAAYTHIENLRATVAQHPAIVLHHDVDTMAELMDRADLSVGAPSSASWERCALGCRRCSSRWPTIS